tara:strand:- start:254 stop:787 length:534 start_codon:yes stop_codon:yes gene_type:complete
MSLMKKRSLILNSFVFIILFIFLFSCSEEKNIAKGKPIIVDGDTIKINGEKIRFGGIDAPETNYYGKKQTCNLKEVKIFCGKLSTEKLIEKIGSSSVSCEREKKKDRNGRTVAECFVNGESLSRFMVKNGYAFDFARYSKKKYAQDEEYAKANKLGIWIMEFEYPWEWRKKIREENK